VSLRNPHALAKEEEILAHTGARACTAVI